MNAALEAIREWDGSCSECDGTGHVGYGVCADCNGDGWDGDLGVCPYYARWQSVPGHDPAAICAFGCADEPQCVTCEPSDGWPSWRRYVEQGEK